jgi:hypothetical protein
MRMGGAARRAVRQDSSPFRGRFWPKEGTSRHSRESGNPGKRRKERPRRLDARLRGHDGPEKSQRKKTRENCSRHEKPTLMRDSSRGFESRRMRLLTYLICRGAKSDIGIPLSSELSALSHQLLAISRQPSAISKNTKTADLCLADC